MTVFKQIRRNDSGCVTYLVGSKDTADCVNVDPLLDVDFVVEEARKEGFDRISHVIDTHTHADHVSGAGNLCNRFNLPGIWMHANSGRKSKTLPVHDGDKLSLDNTTLRFLYTPGHTYDHVCIVVDDSKVLKGDTMLIGDAGRIDLGGDPREKSDKLYDSLHGKLLTLPDAVQVYPTHVGAAHHLGSAKTFSTIANEKLANAALKVNGKEDFFKCMTEDWPPKPPDYQNIIRVNLSDDPLPELVSDEELHKYLGKNQRK